eukprot:g75786.t1
MFTRLTEQSKAEQDELGAWCDCCELSRQDRLYGFAACFFLGWVLSFLSWFAIPDLASRPEKFAVLYTSGNLVALCSTLFLWGPCAQLRKMMDPVRRVASLVMLLALVGCYLAAVFYPEAWLIILLMLLEFCAMFWYSLSYIPYGRNLFLRCCKGCCNSLVDET